MNQNYDTTVTISARPAEVEAALTTLDGLTAWWTTATGDPRTGGDLIFTFGNPEPLRMRVDVAQPDVVQWTCLGYEPMPDWTGTVLRFELTEVDAGCEVHFEQDGLTPRLECFDQCSRSWDHFIVTSLRNYLETGVGDPRGSAADLAWRAARTAAPAAAS